MRAVETIDGLVCPTANQRGAWRIWARQSAAATIIATAAWLSGYTHAGAIDTDTISKGTTGGNVGGPVCKALAFATKQVGDFTKSTLAAKKAKADAQTAVAKSMADRMADSGLPPDDFDKNVNTADFAAVIANATTPAGATPAAEPPSSAPASTAPAPDNDTKWTSYDIARTTMQAASLVDPSGATAVVAAYLYPKCGADEAIHGKSTFCWKDSTPRGIGVIPKGCDSAHPDYQNGLCYQSCAAGMSGDGPICWTQSKVSHPRGAGLIPKSCPSDHPDMDAGLCYEACPDGYNGHGPMCWKGIKATGRGVGKIPNGCPSDHPELQNGLCYASCPSGMSGDGPACWTNEKVSQTRGAGLIPKTCPADHPVYDAGLCYTNCSSGNGLGPVCWATCTGKFNVACGAGCATSKMDCGFATSDMVSTPFEMVGNIISLGTASAETAAARDAETSSKIAAEKLGKQVVKATAKQEAEETAKAAMIEAENNAGKIAEFLGPLSLEEHMELMANDSPKVAESAFKSFSKKTAKGIESEASKLQDVDKEIKGQNGKKLTDYLSAINAKRKMLTPTQNLTNQLEKSEAVAAYLKKLEAVNDKLHLDQIRSAESIVTGCAKLGFTVAKEVVTP